MLLSHSSHGAALLARSPNRAAQAAQRRVLPLRVTTGRVCANGKREREASALLVRSASDNPASISTSTSTSQQEHRRRDQLLLTATHFYERAWSLRDPKEADLEPFLAQGHVQRDMVWQAGRESAGRASMAKGMRHMRRAVYPDLSFSVERTAVVAGESADEAVFVEWTFRGTFEGRADVARGVTVFDFDASSSPKIIRSSVYRQVKRSSQRPSQEIQLSPSKFLTSLFQTSNSISFTSIVFISSFHRHFRPRSTSRGGRARARSRRGCCWSGGRGSSEELKLFSSAVKSSKSQVFSALSFSLFSLSSFSFSAEQVGKGVGRLGCRLLLLLAAAIGRLCARRRGRKRINSSEQVPAATASEQVPTAAAASSEQVRAGHDAARGQRRRVSRLPERGRGAGGRRRRARAVEGVEVDRAR